MRSSTGYEGVPWDPGTPAVSSPGPRHRKHGPVLAHQQRRLDMQLGGRRQRPRAAPVEKVEQVRQLGLAARERLVEVELPVEWVEVLDVDAREPGQVRYRAAVGADWDSHGGC